MKLFEPGKIGTLSIKNRIVMAPMGTIGLVEMDGRFAQRGIEYFATRARGGAGLITTGCILVDNEVEPKVEDYWSFMPRIDSVRFVTGLSELADAIHDYGAKLSVSLTGGYGRVISRKVFPLARQPVAPSPGPWLWDNSVTTRELTTAEVEKIVKAFELAAERARTAGIDAVEIHGHEGYLIDQFMTALWNKRTDKYGGDLDGRFRFPIEIIEAVKRGAGRDFPVIFRYGAKHYLPGGRDIAESQEIAKRLEQVGADALHIDAGVYETWHWAHPPTYQPPGCLVDMAEAIKKVVTIPIIAVGKLGYPELAERVLEEEKADFIALGRPLLADPEWPTKVKEGRLEDIRMCVGDHDGCIALKTRRVETEVVTGPERRQWNADFLPLATGDRETDRIGLIRSALCREEEYLPHARACRFEAERQPEWLSGGIVPRWTMNIGIRAVDGDVQPFRRAPKRPDIVRRLPTRDVLLAREIETHDGLGFRSLLRRYEHSDHQECQSRRSNTESHGAPALRHR